MSKNSTLITIGLLILSSLLLYIHLQAPDKGQKFAFGKTAFAESIPDNLESIVVQRGDEIVELKRAANYRWEVKANPASFAADEDKIWSFLAKLISVRVGDLIPVGEARPQVFGFSAASKVEGERQANQGGSYVALRGANSAPLLEMELGKKRQFGGGMYARFAGRPDVYLIAENFSDIDDWQFWLNKEILDIGNQEIAAIDFLMLKGSPRIARKSAEAPWKEIKKINNSRAFSSPLFKQETLPKLINSLQDLQFIQVIAKDSVSSSLTGPRGVPEHELVSKIGLELFSGKYITATLYKHQGNASNAVSPYYASFRMKLVNPDGRGKYESISTVVDIATFNSKSEPWVFALDNASAQRFLVN